MALHETQNFLARLYTDDAFRRAFLAEPGKIGRENDLTEKEIAELTAILPAELNFFADSLYRKRLREVEKFLPLTRKILGGGAFAEHFRTFSQEFNPKSVKKHLEDAIEFCSYLLKKVINPPWAKDTARFEQSRLIFNSHTKNFLFARFDFDIKHILRDILHREAVDEFKDFPRKKRFAVWLRFGKSEKHLII